MTHVTSLRAVALGIVLLYGSTVPAFAALGGDAASVEGDRAQMKGQLRTTSAAGYAVQEIALPSGTVVREYVATSGKVFAVSWRGPTLPNLRQTLGTYFTQYAAAGSVNRSGHHHLALDEPALVIHSNGHMRAFYGQAYLPALLPGGFVVSDIQ